MAQFTPDSVRLAHKQLQDALKQGRLRQDSNSKSGGEKKDYTEAEKKDLKRSAPKLLRASDIERGANYDAGQVLKMTYGSRIIEFTAQDLQAFRDNIEFIQKQFGSDSKTKGYIGGITAKQVIDMSRQEDINRANQQIHLAVPLSIKNGVVHFLTNASAGSNVTNHHVEVEFLGFVQVAASTNITPKQTKDALNFGRLKYECDCGRFKYWYRYIATVGKFSYGRNELVYPKIRNPDVSGVACKHVIRVMDYIRSPSGVAYMQKQIDKARSKQPTVRSKLTDAQVLAELEKQANGKVSTIKGDHDLAMRKMMKTAAAIAKTKQNKIEQARKKELSAQDSESARKAQKANDLKRYQSLLDAGMLTQAEFNKLSRGIK